MTLLESFALILSHSNSVVVLVAQQLLVPRFVTVDLHANLCFAQPRLAPSLPVLLLFRGHCCNYVILISAKQLHRAALAGQA